jgi:predicted PurR-regulated permease PerM
MEINRKTLRTVFLGVAGCILLYWLLHETDRVKAVFQVVQDLISPFAAGAILAFVLNVPMRGIERQLSEIEKPGTRRGVAILLTLLALLIVVFVVFQLVVPQVVETCMRLVQRLPGFFTEVQARVMLILEEHPEIEQWLTENTDFETVDWATIIKNVADWAATAAGTVVDKAVGAVGDVINGVWDVLVAVVFALYCLSSKETLARQGRKLSYALLRENSADELIRVLRLSNSTFSNFIAGQCLEVCILGCMFAVAMSIFGMPYAPLVSVLVAVTAFVPLVGAFIGCVLGAFFILVDSPILAVYFVIMFLVLQQIENNLVYPRVVGTSIGLPSMWVLVAVSVGGGLMGVAGMVLMIPMSSVLYTLAREYAGKRVTEAQIDPSKLEPHPPELESKFKRKRKEKNTQKISEMVKKINVSGKDNKE